MTNIEFDEMKYLFKKLDNFIREHFNDGELKITTLNYLKNSFEKCVEIIKK